MREIPQDQFKRENWSQRIFYIACLCMCVPWEDVLLSKLRRKKWNQKNHCSSNRIGCRNFQLSTLEWHSSFYRNIFWEEKESTQTTFLPDKDFFRLFRNLINSYLIKRGSSLCVRLMKILILDFLLLILLKYAEAYFLHKIIIYGL